MYLVFGFYVVVSLFSMPYVWASDVPCRDVRNLTAAIDCIQTNEPAFQSATQGDVEAQALENSAYRLINPELQLEYLSGESAGLDQKEANASLLFTLELGGKRSARAKILGAEGLLLQADAFEQQIGALTELGGALLRINQLRREKAVLQESAGTFRRVIKLFRSRGQLPPEQRVGLNTFELIVLDYDRKLLAVETELVRFSARTEKLFGSEARGQPLVVEKFIPNIQAASRDLEGWIQNTPEMLRIRSQQAKVDGEFAFARAEVWPDLKIGPALRQTTTGPLQYQSYGLNVSFSIPVLTWNGSLRKSRSLTESRVNERSKWEAQDVRSLYSNTLSQLEKISKLLQEIPSEEDVHRKHAASESLYDRGLVGGALMIEAHRAIVDFYETKHSLERQFLENSLKIRILAGSKVGAK